MIQVKWGPRLCAEPACSLCAIYYFIKFRDTSSVARVGQGNTWPSVVYFVTWGQMNRMAVAVCHTNTPVEDGQLLASWGKQGTVHPSRPLQRVSLVEMTGKWGDRCRPCATNINFIFIFLAEAPHGRSFPCTALPFAPGSPRLPRLNIPIATDPVASSPLVVDPPPSRASAASHPVGLVRVWLRAGNLASSLSSTSSSSPLPQIIRVPPSSPGARLVPRLRRHTSAEIEPGRRHLRPVLVKSATTKSSVWYSPPRSA